MQKLIGKMAKMFPMLILVGFMIVAAAVVIGYFNAQTAQAYFSQPKVVRETTLMAQRASFESIGLWLPYFKFLGIGLILGGIVMALRVIIDNLQAAGEEVLENLPAAKRPALPKPPWYGLMMPVVMMIGELIFIYALVVGLNLAGTARALFANPLPTIDAAGTGSTLLAQVQVIHATKGWLIPLKFFAISTEFLSITMGLATIVYILKGQINLLARGVDIGRELSGEAVSDDGSRERVAA